MRVSSEMNILCVPQTVEEFMQSFREYLEVPTRFKNTLMPTGAAEGADIRSCTHTYTHTDCPVCRVRFGRRDSLVQMLLGVDMLQPLVIDALLEWLPDYMSDGAMG